GAAQPACNQCAPQVKLLPPTSLDVDHFSRHAAVDDEVRPGDESGPRAIEQECDNFADVARFSHPAGRMLEMILAPQLPCLPVLIQPGLTQFTRTSGAGLTASAWVRATSPPFEAA